MIGLSANAQSRSAKTAIYTELFGNAGLYSINVERHLLEKLNIRVGLGSWSNPRGELGEMNFLTIPVMFNSLFGNRNSKLELGTGLLLIWKNFDPENKVFSGVEDNNDTLANITGVLGYRFQKPDGGFMFRVGITPFLPLSTDESAFPKPGFSVGAGISAGYGF